MIRIGTVLTCVALCTGQSYTINILGLPAVNVEQDMSTPGRIEFKTQNRGIFDMIWPARNVYSSHYDPETFGVTQWQKKIKQGEFKSNVSAKLDSTGSLVYDNKTKVNIEGATQTIFTLLAMVQFRDMEALDTQWFDYEHEGQLGKARFVWSDSTPTWNGKDSILCDHYRLDIEIKKEIGKFMMQTDYFMEGVVADGIVRELWVSRKAPKKIIQASIKAMWFPVTAMINE